MRFFEKAFSEEEMLDDNALNYAFDIMSRYSIKDEIVHIISAYEQQALDIIRKYGASEAALLIEELIKSCLLYTSRCV